MRAGKCGFLVYLIFFLFDFFCLSMGFHDICFGHSGVELTDAYVDRWSDIWCCRVSFFFLLCLKFPVGLGKQGHDFYVNQIRSCKAQSCVATQSDKP